MLTFNIFFMETAKPVKYPIPSKLNTVLSIAIIIAALGLLILGSKMERGWTFALIAFLFGMVMVPAYSMVHEAEHHILHQNKKLNYTMGYLLSLLFMAPFTFFQQCHIGHHKRNRTDFEMFDLHYEHQSRGWRSFYLHIGRLGFQWILLPFSTFLFLFFPRVLTGSFFRMDLMTEGMLSGLYKETIPRIRLESLGVALFHILLFWGLDFAWQNYLIMYLVHGFIWSSQNYVNHAYSERDIINGAHNHKLPKWLQAFYLNFNLHLAHHQHPKVPWLYLEELVDHNDPKRISFFTNYLRLWGGTVLTREPSPVPLDELRNRSTYQKVVNEGEK